MDLRAGDRLNCVPYEGKPEIRFSRTSHFRFASYQTQASKQNDGLQNHISQATIWLRFACAEMHQQGAPGSGGNQITIANYDRRTSASWKSWPFYGKNQLNGFQYGASAAATA